MAEEPGAVLKAVSVIGGSCFLGQHLIKQLNIHEVCISFISVLDCMPFKQELEYDPEFEIHSFVGSVTSMEDLLVATKGVTTVFHLASLTDRSMFPDLFLSDLVNVTGTKNVILACQQNGVKNLVYASDVAVVMGYADIKRGTEEGAPYPKVHLFQDGYYKSLAEQLVLQANSDGTVKPMLQTVSIRLVNLYGELDAFRWPRLVQVAALNHGHVPCVGSMKNKLNMMYAGNAARALVCAHDALNKDPRKVSDTGSSEQDDSKMSDSTKRDMKYPAPVLKNKDDSKKNESTSSQEITSSVSQSIDYGPKAGQAYFVTDQTPPVNFLLFMQPLLFRYGFFLTSWSLPEKWTKVVAWVVYVILWLLYPLVHINPPFSMEDMHELCHTYTFNDSLAKQRLDYRPVYSFKESIHRTKAFYDDRFKEAMASSMLSHVMGSRHLGTIRRMSTFIQNIEGIKLGDSGKKYRNKASEKFLRL